MSVRLVVPLVPPSVNSYVRHTRNGRHYVTAAAKAFKQAVALVARRKRVQAEKYTVSILIYLAAKQKGDIDNFAKVVLDALVDAGVIHSDAAICELHMERHRDPANPRTEIVVEEF